MKSRIIREDITKIIPEFRDYLKTLAGKQILITGANGMIPSYLAETFAEANTFLERPCQLFLYGKTKTTESSRLGHLLGDKNVQFFEADIGRNFEIQGKPSLIIHGASIANPLAFKKSPIETIDANVNGTRILLDYARMNPIDAFLLMSSSEVYGNPPKEKIPTSEDYFGNVDSLGDMACYAEAKRFSETLCSSFARQYGVPTKIARIFHTYGPGLRNDGKTLANMFATGMNARKISLRDPGEARRAYSYVGDTARGLLYLLSKGKNGEAYNVGNDENSVPVREMAENVREILGLEEAVQVPASYGSGERIQHRAPVLKKLRELGFKPEIGVREGLTRLAEYYREVGI